MQSHSQSAFRVLFAEDTDDLRRVTALQLLVAGFDVDVARDGNEALKMYEAAKVSVCPYDFLLLDAAMPILDGFACAEAIRAQGDDVKIGFFTAYTDMMTGVRAAVVNACGVWEKTKDTSNLAAEILRVLETR